MYGLFCPTFTGYQCTQELTTRFQPCASTLSPALLLSMFLSFYPSTPLPDTSVHPKTHPPSVFLSTKLSVFGQRAFSFTGQTQWNLLPYGLRHSESSPAFKIALKTHLFRSAYYSSVPARWCVCVCVYVHACVCMCVRACMHACHVCVHALSKSYWCLFLVLSMDFYVCTCYVRVVWRHVFKYCCNHYTFCC